MIEQRLDKLSQDLGIKLTFKVEKEEKFVDIFIYQTLDNVPIPCFSILCDLLSQDEKYVLSVLESPITVLFGSELCDTISVFTSNDLEPIFLAMESEFKNQKKLDFKNSK